MSESVHTARWILQMERLDWDIHLFPADETDELHPLLRGKVTFHPWIRTGRSGPDSRGIPLPELPGKVVNVVSKRLNLLASASRLARLIAKLKPQIVHSLEFQAAGYLTLAAREKLARPFPAWMASNWGSDIYLFGKLPEHQRRIRSILAHCDFYISECRRDVRLAQEMGLQGEVMGVLPSGGGLCLSRIAAWRAVPPSRRRRIVLKGYQGWAGRALCGLRALEMIADKLQGFEVLVYLANPEVMLKAALVSSTTGLPIRIVDHVSHDSMLQVHGSARVSIGLSISDAASTSFLEAMTMGAFPIQSNTACADEWVIDGESAILVPPEETEVIAKAILRAVGDDALVDEAAKLNYAVAKEKLDYAVVQEQVLDIYHRATLKLRAPA